MEENTTLTWQAFDKTDKERKVDWFWALGIIAIAGSVLAFLFGNFLFGVFILLAVVILIFLITQKPKRIECSLNEKGITIDGTLTPYQKIKGFYLDETHEWGKILLHTDHPISAIVSVFYEDKALGDDIYEMFQKYEIPEEYLVEPISQQIFEKLGL